MAKAQVAPTKDNKSKNNKSHASKNEKRTERSVKQDKQVERPQHLAKQEKQVETSSKRDRKNRKEKTQTEEAPSPALTQTTTETTPTETTTQEQQSVRDQLADEYKSVRQAGKDLLEQVNKFRKLVDTYYKSSSNMTGRLERDNKKLHGKRRNRTNSKAIQRPFPMSDSLCEFLGMDHGSELPRTEVTKLLCAYANEHCTRSKTDRKYFHPDAKMAKLLGLKKGETIDHIIGLQKRIKAQRLFLPVQKQIETTESTESTQ